MALLGCSCEQCLQFPRPSSRLRVSEAPGARAVEDEAYCRCIFGLGHLFVHSTDAARRGHAHRQIECFFRKLRKPAQTRATTRKNQTCGNLSIEAGATKLVFN